MQGQGLGEQGGNGPKGQNLFCTNIVMLHIKSKVMKSRIQWCQHFTPGACLGVTRDQKVGFGVFFIVTQLFLGVWSCDLGTVKGNSPMDEDWRNAFGNLIHVCTEICNGAGAGIGDGAPTTWSSISYTF